MFLIRASSYGGLRWLLRVDLLCYHLLLLFDSDYPVIFWQVAYVVNLNYSRCSAVTAYISTRVVRLSKEGFRVSVDSSCSCILAAVLYTWYDGGLMLLLV